MWPGPVYLGLGGDVEVLAPAALRLSLVDFAEQIVAGINRMFRRQVKTSRWPIRLDTGAGVPYTAIYHASQYAVVTQELIENVVRHHRIRYLRRHFGSRQGRCS